MLLLRDYATLQEDLLLHMFEESVMELVLLVAAHADERAFRSDAVLLLDLLSEVYTVSMLRGMLSCPAGCCLH